MIDPTPIGEELKELLKEIDRALLQTLRRQEKLARNDVQISRHLRMLRECKGVQRIALQATTNAR